MTTTTVPELIWPEAEAQMHEARILALEACLWHLDNIGAAYDTDEQVGELLRPLAAILRDRKNTSSSRAKALKAQANGS